jgi:hypothetical protein
MSQQATQASSQPGMNQIGEAPPQIPAEAVNGMVTTPRNTPNVMPGAGAASKQPDQPLLTQSGTATTETSEAPKPAETKAAETVELDRFKAVQQIARKNEDDAKRWRTLSETLATVAGGEEGKSPDPMTEIQKLRNEVARERVARETGIPPELIGGGDEESMRATAEIAKALIAESAKAQAALLQPATPPAPVTPPPAAFPASSVASDGKILGPVQLTRDQLRGMTSAQIVEAMKDGRCDQMMGKIPAM